MTDDDEYTPTDDELRDTASRLGTLRIRSTEDVHLPGPEEAVRAFPVESLPDDVREALLRQLTGGDLPDNGSTYTPEMEQRAEALRDARFALEKRGIGSGFATSNPHAAVPPAVGDLIRAARFILTGESDQ